MLYEWYEGGQDDSKDRYNDKYGDDVGKFNVKDSSGIEGGLKEDRGCTDILCLLIWFAFLGSIVFLAVYGGKNGNLPKLIAPVNGDLQLCGASSDFKNHKYLYFTDFKIQNIDNLFSSGICVEECPTATTDKLDCQNTEAVPDCTQVNVYKSSLVGVYCIPDVATLPADTKAGWEAAYKAFMNSSAGSYVNDLYLSSTAIFASLGMALVYCFLFMAIMSAFAEYISWICIVLVQLGLIAGAVGCFLLRTASKETYDAEEAEVKAGTAEEKLEHDKNFKSTQMWLMVGMVTFGVLALGFLCCIVCAYKSLKLAIDVIDASADFLNGTKRVIFVPVLYFFLTLLVVAVWLGALMLVLSVNDVTPSKSIPQGKTIKWKDDKTYYAFLYMIFGILWITAWLEYTA